MHSTPSERRAHLDLWRESGLSKAAYCRAVGLSYRSFVTWTKRTPPATLSDQDQSSGPAFVQLDDDRPDTKDPDSALVVHHGDLVLTFAAGSGPDWVAAVLAGLIRC